MNRQIVTKTTTSREVPRKRTTKKRRARRRNGARKASGEGPPGYVVRANQFRLSDCADLYLRVLSDPHQPYSNACVPDIYDTPSFKVRTVQRGLVQTGAQGKGYIICDVWRNAFNNGNSVNATLSTYLGDGTIIGGLSADIAVSNNNQSPFTLADLGNNEGTIQFRPVAVGMRVRYIGTELNRGGRLVPFRHPANRNVLGYKESDMLAFAECHPQACNRQWVQTRWVPVAPLDYQYRADQTGFTAAAGNNQNTICVALDSPAANFFEYEIVSYFEFTGAVTNVTPSHSDVQGISAVRGFIENQYSSVKGSVYQSAIEYFKNLTPADISGWVSTASGISRKAAPLLIGL